MFHLAVYDDAKQSFQQTATHLVHAATGLSVTAIVKTIRELSTTLYYCSKQCHCYSIACCLVDCQCSADGSVVVTATDAGIVSIFVTPSLSDSHLASVFISADAAGSSLVSAMSVFCASFTSLNATATQATSIHAAGTLARHAL